MDENVRNQPAVNKSETDNKKIEKYKEACQEKTSATPMMMMETCQPPSSPQPGPFLSGQQDQIVPKTSSMITIPVAVDQRISMNDNTLINISQGENTTTDNVVDNSENNNINNDNVTRNNNNYVAVS